MQATITSVDPLGNNEEVMTSDSSMNRGQAVRLAKRLLGKHGLADVEVEIGRAKTICGSAHFNEDGSPRAVRLSQYHIELNSEEEIEDTILHEIAHLLAGPHKHHGPKWQAIARELGTRREACSRTAIMPSPEWRAYCRKGEHYVGRVCHRKPTSLHERYCSACGPA